MKQKEICAMQERLSVTPDGFWGPKSIAACQRYLRSLMQSGPGWPKSDQTSLTSFYGQAGDETQLVNLPAPVLIYYAGKRIKTLRCHRKVSESLGRVLAAAYEMRPDVIQDYAGCYNNRPMRGGSLPSLHARGAAIDLRAAQNGNRISWPVAADMPLEVMECFAREGWLAAGAWWGRDAMHFQATQ